MENLKKQILANHKCNAQDVVFDIKTIMQDFYFAQFSADANKLNISFDNGQKFTVTVKEC